MNSKENLLSSLARTAETTEKEDRQMFDLAASLSTSFAVSSNKNDTNRQVQKLI